MGLSTIGRVAAVVGLLAGCGSGGPGTVDVPDDPAGPFAGHGSPGPFAGNQNGGPFGPGSPGPFSGPGSPGVGGQPVADPNQLCAAVCARLVAVCPRAGNSCERDCTEIRRLGECERNLFVPYLNCVLAASFTCDDDEVEIVGCAEPRENPCQVTPPPPIFDAGGPPRDAGGPPRDAGATRDGR